MKRDKNQPSNRPKQTKPYASDNRNHIFGFRDVHINIIILKLVI